MNQSNSAYQFKYRRLSQALFHALKHDPFYTTIELYSTEYEPGIEPLLIYLDYSMIEAEIYGELYIPVEHSFGASVWLKPLTRDREARRKRDKKEFLLSYMGDECNRVYHDIVEFMSNQSSGFVDSNSWYLSIVGILPEHQGKGLGVELVTEVLERTDRLRVPTYLETFTPQNESFYRRLGYQVVASIYEPTIKSNYSLMARAPVGG